MVLASRLQGVRRVAAGRRTFASTSGSTAPVNHHSASPAYSGRATHNTAVRITGVNEQNFSFARMLAANQKAYNAAHYPSTPVPSTYKMITTVTNAMVDVVMAVAFVGMGAAMSTGIWAPYVINAQRRAAEKRFAPLKGEIN